MTATLNDNRRYVMRKARELAARRQRGGRATVNRQDVLSLPLMDIVDMVLELLPLVDIDQMVVAKTTAVMPCVWCGTAMKVKANRRFCSEACRRGAHDEWQDAS